MSGHDKFDLPKDAEPYVATAEQATARWREKLGLKRGEEPVLFTEVLSREDDGKGKNGIWL